MKLPAFDYVCPTTLAEAVTLLAAHDGDAKVLAGGQSLVPMMAFRVASPSLLVDLRKLPGLDGIRIDDAGVRLGALVRWRDILDDARLARAHPLLVAAIRHVAHYQVPLIFSSLVARVSGPPMSITNDIKRAIWSVDKDQPVWAVRSLEAQRQASACCERWSGAEGA